MKHNLSYDEFKSVVESCEQTFTGVYQVYSDIVDFFWVNKDQSSTYTLTDVDNLIDIDTLAMLEKFGISRNVFIANKEYYVLYVNPADISASLDSFTQIAGDGTPTHIVVLSEDRSIIKSTVAKIKESYPDIISTQEYESGVTSDTIRKSIEKTLGTTKVFDITSYCEMLSEEDRKSVNYITTFNKTVDEIHEKSQGRILIYTGSYAEEYFYISLCVELYLRYFDRFYIAKNMISTVCSRIMSVLFNRTYQLFEESYEYFRKIPRILIEIKDFGSVYNLVKSKRLALNLTYLPIDSEDPDQVKTETLDVSSIEVRSIYDYFNIDTIEGCDYMKSKLYSLYKIMGLKKELLNVTNIIIFHYNDKVNIGYIEDADFSVEVYSVNRDVGSCIRTLKYEDICRCVPPNVFLEGEIYCAKLFGTKIENFKLSMIRPYRTKRQICDLLINGLFRNNADWNIPELSISTIGLFCNYDAVVRSGFINNFINLVGIDEMRKKIDCFGGFNPRIVKGISLGGN